ncbi:unnamed protein product [Rotaria magnacalcarata]|uniref:Uncharacterized protein n=4 Tax=Rotaria magnacalcarata TaxID=392030 RepID=A0A816WKR2_9BILA|nr:unnamed protein product [Rotaria magnacalcarata]CAF2132042.1 unnamed protein product [Rotaria magnacalcarata]CAF2135557.1 unnamed protein product [Rotaria magnacalcarata]CAF3849585.1 unnamed protein product [Rotaria magnacalcarata]CAF3916351.1 unnamed protein product [Rotaria magnacalcarata]
MSCHVYLVAGYVYELNIENMKKIPSFIFNDSVYMKQFYDPIRQVYCISRSRAFFEILVFYINHGILSRPVDIPLDLYIEELNYYFIDREFLSKLKFVYDIPQTSDTTEIRYLPQSPLKTYIWRSIEYNETLFGPMYRFIFGLICICSIFIYMYELVVTRNENFLEFTEKYSGYFQNRIHSVNVTVRFIDYRPDTYRLAFSIEILFVFLWTIELLMYLLSAPSVYFCIKSIFFWIDIINILNAIIYGIFSLTYNRQSNVVTNHIKSMTFTFQCMNIIKTIRMIKLGRYHKSIKLILQSFGEASMDIFTLSIVLLGTSCVFGAVIYSIERTTNPATSTILFPTVGNSVYYTLLAITNVGFEGFLPSTYLGKWIACAAITIGLLTIALPLPLILSPYTEKLLTKNKKIIYQNVDGSEISNDDPDVEYIRDY